MLLPFSTLLAFLLLIAAVPALASDFDVDDDRVPLGELVEIVVLDDQVLGFDAQGGSTSSVKRWIGEQVLWVGTRGLLGVVITTERLLAIATRSSGFQEVVYELSERPPNGAQLGDRVALVVLRQRVIGFLGTAGRFVEARLGPREDLRELRVGPNVGVVVTDHEALGLSPAAGGFFSIRLQLRERIENVVVRSNLATIKTDRRVLVFRSPTGTWAERLD